MIRELLDIELRQWLDVAESNGILQHSQRWLDEKVKTIGGSSLATIQGKNPYSNIIKLISEKIGLTKFESDIKPQWGNLFEDVIKRYVEYDRKCVVLGEDLYVEGPPGTAYSPDGLAVMDIIDDYTFEEESIEQTPTGPKKVVHLVTKSVSKTAIVLCEFKCPFVRIPSGSPPEYYVPQVKMGLDVLKIPSIGVLIEGVFRRCTWEQLGNNPLYDKTLVSKSSGRLPLAFGINGFYFDTDKYEKLLAQIKPEAAEALRKQKEKLWSDYDEFYIEKGDETNGFQCSDLGEAPPKLFTSIMSAYDKKILHPWYGPITFVDANMTSGDTVQQFQEAIGANNVSNNMESFTQFCVANRFINFGILPWKLFRIDYNFIRKDENYLAPWLPKIREILDVVQKCNDPANADIKLNIYSSFVNKSLNCGFSDD